jgi:crotonobetainyl-CoA:carnitine CoA-transferase CaiB-like acyl-CoA transferase
MVPADANYPLAGLKVLDLSRVLAGPFAGRLLCDLGADVVKVEPPDGDITRLWGKVIGGIPGYYHQQNAGKRNICVDLRAPEGVALVLALAKQADILIENYRPDVMPRLGLGYEALKAANPRLIMLSISGFGHGGPESRRPAYAPIVHAEVGLMARAKRRDPGSRGDLPLSVADTNASLHGLIGVLSAVIMRQRTGQGQHIDMAMVDATLATDDQILYELEASEATMGLPNDVWETGAGAILVSADFRYLFRSLTRGAGLADPTTPEMDLDAKIAARRAAVDAFMRALPDWDAVEAAMAGVNIVWGRLRPGRGLGEQPTLRHRGSIAQVDDRAGGTRPIPQSPYRFSNARSGVRAGAPHRGEHNGEVLGDWLGLGEADVARLAESGILGADIPAYKNDPPLPSSSS